DDAVDAVAEEGQVGVRAARLVDDHLLGVDDQPGGGYLGIGEQLLHLFDAAEHGGGSVEHPFFGHGQIRHPGEERPGGAEDAPFGGEDPLEVPGEDLGQGEQPEGLGGGGAVHDDGV